MTAGENIKKGKRSFGNRLLVFFVSILAIAGFICMFLCVISPFISPNFWVFTSYFGLAFWFILGFNLLILICLIFLKAKKWILLPLIALIIAIPSFKRSYSIKQKTTEPGNIKVMTYNVCHFSDVTSDKNHNSKQDIIDIINAQNPDIVCMQESGQWNDKTAKDFAEKINCKYYAFNNVKHNGNVFFSKYPLFKDDFTDKCDANTTYVVRGVDAGGLGKFYLECVHLQSFMITNDEIEYINDARIYDRKSDAIGKSVFFKLKEGFEGRTADTKDLVENLPVNGMPIVVCGDFNDTPMSYTYRRMRKAGMNDAFLEVGTGLGKTYCGKLPLLRIDYFWHNDYIVPMTYERVKKKLSDHYPIIMTFNVTH